MQRSDIAPLLEQARAHLAVCVGQAPAWLPDEEHWDHARQWCVAAEMEARATLRDAGRGDTHLHAAVARLTRAVEALHDARHGAADHPDDDLTVIAQGVPLLLARALADSREDDDR